MRFYHRFFIWRRPRPNNWTFSSEHLKGDQIFIEFCSFAVQRGFANKSQEARETVTGESEYERGADLLGLGRATNDEIKRPQYWAGYGFGFTKREGSPWLATTNRLT